MRDVPLIMPKMSMTMTEGVVVGWVKAEGDSVRAGDVVCEVTTDKVDMEVESPVDGTLARIVARPEDTVPVGEPLAYLATESDDLLEGLLDGSTPPAAEPEADRRTSVQPALRGATPPSRRTKPAVPGARRRAAELGIDLAGVTGTGPGGTVRLVDVDQAAQRREPAVAAVPRPDGSPPDGAAARRRTVRAAVNRVMTASAAVPQFTVYADLDLDAAAAARGSLSWTTVLLIAVARTLREHPALNALVTDGEARTVDAVGLALAVDTPAGLLAPVVRDPDRGDPAEADAGVRRLVDRARSGRLGAADLADATFTVSNLGGWGVTAFNALITPPQAAALSVGAVAQRPVVRHGGIAVRTVCTVGLTVDHRAADGADAARFLADLAALLGNPGALLGTPWPARAG